MFQFTLLMMFLFMGEGYLARRFFTGTLDSTNAIGFYLLTPALLVMLWLYLRVFRTRSAEDENEPGLRISRGFAVVSLLLVFTAFIFGMYVDFGSK